MHAPRTAVIGVGNLLLTDEGVGVHVIHALQKAPLAGKGELTIIDGGTCPETFYRLPAGVDRLIIVDAVRGGCEPGTIYRFTPPDVVFGGGPITSLHQLGLAESLRMIQRTELNPKEVVIIGVEPKEIGWGLAMSPELQNQVPRILDCIEEEISRPIERPNDARRL